MSLTLQEALNAGSGVNLRGGVGNYFENFCNTQINSAYNDSDVVILAGTEQSLETSVLLNYKIGQTFATLAANTQIDLDGETVPDGFTSVWYVPVGFFPASPLKAVQGATISEDFNAPINDLILGVTAPTGEAVFCLIQVIVSGGDFIPGTTPLNDGIVFNFQAINISGWPIQAPSFNLLTGPSATMGMP